MIIAIIKEEFCTRQTIYPISIFLSYLCAREYNSVSNYFLAVKSSLRDLGNSKLRDMHS